MNLAKTGKYRLIISVVIMGILFSELSAVALAPVPSDENAKKTEVKSSPATNVSGKAAPVKIIPVKTTSAKTDKTDQHIVSVNNKTSKPADIGLNLDVKDSKKPELKITEPKKIEGELFQSDKEKMQQAFEVQKQLDIDDIRELWEASVERNTVVKFAIKKLAMPAEQRRIHSSLMAKSVSALISGASILPSLFGVDSMAGTASMASGSLANRIIQNRTIPKEMPLTDTELIQLAKLVDNLQDNLIKNYYDYKSSIEALKVCRQNLILHNKNYSNAISSGNSISIIAASALYDKETLNEIRLKQQIKLARLELERLAGSESVSKLTLSKVLNSDSDIPRTEESAKPAAGEARK